MVVARSLLGSRMIPSRVASTSMWVSRSGPYVRFFVIRAVIRRLSDMASSPRGLCIISHGWQIGLHKPELLRFQSFWPGIHIINTAL